MIPNLEPMKENSRGIQSRSTRLRVLTLQVARQQKLGELFAVHNANVFLVSLSALMECVLAVPTFQTCHLFESAFF